MKINLTSFFVGLLFALGLGISGMTKPENVIGFLDAFGKWNPSLLFVMLGALSVHLPLYHLIRKRRSPILAVDFLVPVPREIDRKLVFGSILFGIGWGLGGYCPAPAIAAVASLALEPILFVGAMLIGMLVFIKIEKQFLTNGRS